MTNDNSQQPEISPGALTCPAPGNEPQFPRAYVRLKIDVTLMSPDDIKKIFQAEHLLQEVGVGWDAGIGGGARDWELDWSMSGAWVDIRPVRCRNCDISMFEGRAIWLVGERARMISGPDEDAPGAVEIYGDERYPFQNPYCSELCMDADIAKFTAPWNRIVVETAPVGLSVPPKAAS